MFGYPLLLYYIPCMLPYMLTLHAYITFSLAIFASVARVAPHIQYVMHFCDQCDFCFGRTGRIPKLLGTGFGLF